MEYLTHLQILHTTWHVAGVKRSRDVGDADDDMELNHSYSRVRIPQTLENSYSTLAMKQRSVASCRAKQSGGRKFQKGEGHRCILLVFFCI